MLEITYFDSPIGLLEIKGSELGIRSVKRKERREKYPEAREKILLEGVEQLKAYFKRERRVFDLPLDWGGRSAFYQLVWSELLKVPYGHTTSYSAIANAIGQPAAVRAVGMANRNNPIAIIVPCHRVIAKTGHLQGYFYGLDVKRQLLELENPMSFARQETLF
jgi:methylated-DNA-[protein]-cysteine S-methyltransferase